MPPQNGSQPSDQLSQTDATSHLRPVLQWSSELSAIDVNESDNPGWVITEPYQGILRKTLTVKGGLFAILGTQGVGKTATLHRLLPILNSADRHAVLINWSEPNEQIQDLLRYDYGLPIVHKDHPLTDLRERSDVIYRSLLLIEIRKHRMVPIRLPEGTAVPDNLASLDVDWAEKLLGRSKCASVREQTWFRAIRLAKVVLIDLPDYARTDKRLMTRDLNRIYRLWKRLHDYRDPPSIVVSIQKEMIHGHFFFDKMEKIEVRPLTPEEMLRSYVSIFKNAYPFDEAALLALGGLSRGIYRRFKRYISLTIDDWQRHQMPSKLITADLVKNAITSERLAEDLDTELEELFPKNTDSRRDAARIIHHLQASGPMDQTKLGDGLDMPAYTLSRLLSKMDPRYVKRTTDGSRKIVSMTET